MSWHLKLFKHNKIKITFAPRTSVRHDLGAGTKNKLGEEEQSPRIFLE